MDRNGRRCPADSSRESYVPCECTESTQRHKHVCLQGQSMVGLGLMFWVEGCGFCCIPCLFSPSPSLSVPLTLSQHRSNFLTTSETSHGKAQPKPETLRAPEQVPDPKLSTVSENLKQAIWVVVKIMVPFWVRIIIRHLLFRVAKNGP